MSRRDRLEALVHVRELVERRRLAEQAAARREHGAADRARSAARAALRGAAVPAGTSLVPADLLIRRASGVAIGDEVERTEQRTRTTRRAVERADQRAVAAATDRKAAERLAERRAEVIAVEREKRTQRRLDDVALTVWRRGR